MIDTKEGKDQGSYLLRLSDCHGESCPTDALSLLWAYPQAGYTKMRTLNRSGNLPTPLETILA